MQPHKPIKVLCLVISTLILLSCQLAETLVTPASPTPSPTSTATPEPKVTQLLSNEDVEEGGTRPAAWRPGGTDLQNFEILWSSDDAFSSSHSLKISLDPAFKAETFSFWSQTVVVSDSSDISAEATLKLEAMLKLQDIQGTGIALAIRGDDTAAADGNAEVFATSEESEVITGTRDWTAYQVALSNVPSGIKSFTVYLLYESNTSGTVYFDDITLSLQE